MTTRIAFLVLGMHRGGTSATAGALHHAGASAGEGLIGPSEANPAGYFESRFVTRTMDTLLTACGSAWDDPRQLRLEAADSQAFDALKIRLQEHAATLLRHADVVTIKDPRNARAVDLWRSLIHGVGARTVAVHPVRHPVAVWRSLAARNQMDVGHAGLLWLRHMLDGERGSRGLPRVFVNYEDLVRDPAPMLREAGRLAGREWPVEGLERARGHVTQSLQRQEVDEDGCALMDLVAPLAAPVHEILASYARNGWSEGREAELDALSSSLESVWRPFDAYVGVAIRERSSLSKTVVRLQSRLESRTPIRHEKRAAVHPPALVELADLLGQVNEINLMTVLLERALALSPGLAETVQARAHAAREAGRASQADAITACLTAVQHAPAAMGGDLSQP